MFSADDRGAIETPSLEDSLNVFSVPRGAGAAQLLLCVERGHSRRTDWEAFATFQEQI